MLQGVDDFLAGPPDDKVPDLREVPLSEYLDTEWPGQEPIVPAPESSEIDLGELAAQTRFDLSIVEEIATVRGYTPAHIPTPSDPTSATVIDRMRREAIDTALTSLHNTEQVRILEMRYGRDRGSPMSHSEISKALDLNRDQVREHINKGLSKLRHTHRNPQLKGFLEE